MINLTFTGWADVARYYRSLDAHDRAHFDRYVAASPDGTFRETIRKVHAWAIAQDAHAQRALEGRSARAAMKQARELLARVAGV